ncbi:response regulator transcription factor [Streptomyces platensis]|uniref:response regulator transcription factor n=1 Tax=Streptomyces platensis TaxID=58346 RepID=UPI0038663209|nr:response regulator transcription factor [Streptomyces platensis]
MKALLIEDDEEVAQALMEGLQQHGWTVEHMAAGIDAARRQVTEDIVLLDLNLPDVDGFEVCRHLRSVSDVPIIVVSARSDTFDQALGLWLGADDYVVKPYALHELLARMAAVLRRGTASRSPAPPVDAASADAEATAEEQILCRGPLKIDQERRQVSLRDSSISLTRKEFELLALLAGTPGRVYTREYIVEHVWMQRWIGKSRTVDSHVAALRRKLGDPGWIETVRGVGLRFVTRN